MRRLRLVGCLLAALVTLGTGASVAAAAPAYVPVAGSPFGSGFAFWGAAFSPGGGFFATSAYYDQAVYMYKVSSSGGLTAIPGATGLGNNPNALAFGRQGSKTYLGVVTNSGVLLFSVSSSGALSQVGTTIHSSHGPTSVAFNPSGTLMAVGTYSGVEMYGVSSTGLTSLGFTNDTNNDESSVAFSPKGHSLAVALQFPGRIKVYSVGTDGSLTSVGLPVSAGTRPDSVAYSPTGGLLAAADQGSDSILMFSVNPSTGALTAAGSGASTGAAPSSVAFSPSGKLVATSNSQGGSLSLFSVGSGGALAPVSGSPLSTGSNTKPAAVAFSPTGLLAAPRLSTGVSVFAPAPPGVGITSPSGRRVFARGASVATRFTCAESVFGPGLASCADSTGGHSPGGRLSTASVGAHTYSVFGESRDGQTGAARFNYFVFNAPSVTLSGPRSGKTYKLRARVKTKFSCHDGAGAPGVATCADSNGSSSGRGRLNTGHYGLWHYVVTAVSKDTLVTRRTIVFRVAASPSASITSPVAGRHYARGQRVRASFACHDGLGGPGIKSCRGTRKKGKRINTSRPGQHRFVVVARSRDGRRVGVVISYFVR